MNTVEIIEKKKNLQELSSEEISYIINGYVNGSIPDYQVSSLLMAIRLNGMTENETVNLTDAMVKSGETIDLSPIEGFKVDKHSTGGIGDKVSLIVAPILAALNIPVAKMSGRGLGITGGTLDKLESVEGFRIELQPSEFINQVNEHKISIIGQTGNLVPADKKLYALRDVTGTVDSIPLIASSIMSKKIASGADGIVLDVKCGNGAFMKTPEEAAVLAETMIKIGEGLGRKVSAIITDMNQPIGYAIGNKIEVMEAQQFLHDYTKAEKSLRNVSIKVASMMYKIATGANEKEANKEIVRVLEDKTAFSKFNKFIRLQGGKSSSVLTHDPKHTIEVKAEKEGYLAEVNAELAGRASLALGAGRKTKEDSIDYDAGVKLTKSAGDKIKVGDIVAYMYTDKEDHIDALNLLQKSFNIVENLSEDELKPSIINVLSN